MVQNLALDTDTNNTIIYDITGATNGLIKMELPDEIVALVKQCETNVTFFTNDEMSIALKYGEMLHRRLVKVIEHYERRARMYMPNDIRALCDKNTAALLRDVLADSKKDL